MRRREPEGLREAFDLLSLLRLIVFLAAMTLIGLKGAHWTSFLYLAAGLIAFPGKWIRALYQRLRIREWIAVVLALALLVAGVCLSPPTILLPDAETAEAQRDLLASLPAYAGEPFVEVNGNVPFFQSEDLTATSYETYGKLDLLGRCTVCIASVGRDLMPTAPRESIYEIKPTGWQSVRYGFIDGESLYNRCHLIGFQLTAENANANNLITGTRYLNTEGMLPFEDEVASYVRQTGNHVLYRVTPLFSGSDLVARGVLMEAESVEDGGAGVLFCVFCYNVQPGVEIDYATGDNWLAAA